METKATAGIDVSRLKVINKIVGDVPITDGGWIDHAGRDARTTRAREDGHNAKALRADHAPRAPARGVAAPSHRSQLWRRCCGGVLGRERMREGELIALTWSCLDLERGVLTLDENKTDDPRAWAMNPA